MPDAAPTSTAYVRRLTMIVTGLLLYTFILCHLGNLMLAFHSIEMMDRWRPTLTAIWGGPVLRELPVASITIHFTLALWSIYRRNTLRVPNYDAAQLVAGALIIPLLAPHVTGVIAAQAIGVKVGYGYLMPYFWVSAPQEGLRQVLMLVVIWIHGSIGVYTFLRARDQNGRVIWLFYPLVVAVPVAALLGYVEGGRHILAPENGGITAALERAQAMVVRPVSPERVAEVLSNMTIANRILGWGALALIALALLARWLRVRGLGDRVAAVAFLDGRPARFEAETGLTLLEMARVHDVPHANICRGRGRCGTCRVRVLRADSPLSPPDKLEANTLKHWNAPPDVRLACQIAPGAGVLEVERLVSPDYSDLDYSETGPADPEPTAEPAA